VLLHGRRAYAKGERDMTYQLRLWKCEDAERGMGWVTEKQGKLLFRSFPEGGWQSDKLLLETFGPGQEHERRSWGKSWIRSKLLTRPSLIHERPVRLSI